MKLDTPDIKWADFHNKFKELGGDGFYGAWRLTYTEPYFSKVIPDKHTGCPVAEAVQPYLMQFKTNYGNDSDIAKQYEALKKTISHFDR